jgi:metal-responsive CopG/Arc/MetJ family transcriptional regulator
MKRTTISLPDELASEISREAQRRGASVSEVTRDALREHLDSRAGQDLPFVGIGRSGHHDVARQAEEILAQELGSDAGGR